MRRQRKIQIMPKRSSSSKNLQTQNATSKLDIWLLRISHISQFGLFALTVGALYFTVIPLYKVAALEESIARRELELDAASEKLKLAILDLEKKNQELYKRDRQELVERIYFAAPYCSGLMQPPRVEGSEEVAELGRNILKVDAAQCLIDRVKESEFEKTLTPIDNSYLISIIEDIASRLSAAQIKASKDIASVPERATKDPSILAPNGANAEQLDKLLDQLSPHFRNEEVRYKAAIDRTQFKIAFDFADFVQSEILRLKRIDWPDSKSKA